MLIGEVKRRSRYIDEYAIKYFVSVTNDGCFYRVAFKDEIDKIPTADVVPMDFHNKVLEVEIKKQENLVNVVHGRWIEDRLCTTNGGTYGVRRCSVCEDYYQDLGYGWNYGPNCGARMAEREEEQ